MHFIILMRLDYLTLKSIIFTFEFDIDFLVRLLLKEDKPQAIYTSFTHC